VTHPVLEQIGFAPSSSRTGEPVWELALAFPVQGQWTESEYLSLDLGCLVEFSDGRLEFPPVPTLLHQFIVDYLHSQLKQFVQQFAEGAVLFAPVPVWISTAKYREPDVFYLRPGRIRDLRGYPRGADLVMEVLSGNASDRERDLVAKREDYAAAGISEYWIVDPDQHQITVLVLEGSRYREHGVFGRGQTATSLLLQGFAISVDATFAAGQETLTPRA
jgi:Uma2 family endonuclease